MRRREEARRDDLMTMIMAGWLVLFDMAGEQAEIHSVYPSIRGFGCPLFSFFGGEEGWLAEG
jgi:hypothetical protein